MSSMWVVTVTCVFACLVAVGAMYAALVALDRAAVSVRTVQIQSGVTRLAADFVVLSDDVSSLRTSLSKLRNRENARHARDSKKQNGTDDDDEWLKGINQKIAVRGVQDG